MTNQIILASNNKYKQAEFKQLLNPLNFQILNQDKLGIKEVNEDRYTFIENAILKARNASNHINLPAIADDSGICVPSLSGKPGVLSARYAGEEKSDKANNLKLIKNLIGYKDKSAFFYCVIVYLQHKFDPSPIISDAIWEGEIISDALGSNGFGYDPHFWIPSLKKTAAQLELVEKNEISHRGKAFKLLLQKLL